MVPGVPRPAVGQKKPAGHAAHALAVVTLFHEPAAQISHVAPFKK